MGLGKQIPVQGMAVQLPPGNPFPQMATGSPSTQTQFNRLVAAWKEWSNLLFCLKSRSGVDPSRSSQIVGSQEAGKLSWPDLGWWH